MLMVPVILGWNSFGFVVRILEVVCFPKFFYCIVCSANSPQIVPKHVMSMRDRGSQPGVGGPFPKGIVDSADILIRMSQIVMRGEVVCRQINRSLVKPQ